MDKDIKQSLFSPTKNVGAILGFITTILGVIAYFETTASRVIALLCIVIIICIWTIWNLYSLTSNYKKEKDSLILNNNGLVQAKESCLEKNDNLATKLEECLISNKILIERYTDLQNLLKDVILQSISFDLNPEELDFITEHIMEGVYNERKALESYKDN